MAEFKTSNEWWHEHELFDSYRIADPDGWDREHLHYSWYRELISLEEFNRRLNRSTLISKTIDPL